MSESTRSLAVTPGAAPVLPCPEDATRVCDRNGGAPLELHQPEAEGPWRFIGACDRCGRRYLLDGLPLSAEGLMLWLTT